MKLRVFNPRATEWQRMFALAAAFQIGHHHLDPTDKTQFLIPPDFVEFRPAHDLEEAYEALAPGRSEHPPSRARGNHPARRTAHPTPDHRSCGHR
ncbi:hypothetical protein J2S46_008070 [Kitasatospora herbaricolor]|uniref:hypothetical protein n=1 Tax=Kitasatospora herbaricolor TaxID=68217 RepID=UPI00174A2319|nr:hypothetical protein [Kitasatospora herbaricolor]MDQ0313417.1 hypothetical protein [Kitasatospora herbaricolor]